MTAGPCNPVLCSIPGSLGCFLYLLDGASGLHGNGCGTLDIPSGRPRSRRLRSNARRATDLRFSAEQPTSVYSLDSCVRHGSQAEHVGAHLRKAEQRVSRGPSGRSHGTRLQPPECDVVSTIRKMYCESSQIGFAHFWCLVSEDIRKSGNELHVPMSGSFSRTWGEATLPHHWKGVLH